MGYDKKRNRLCLKLENKAKATELAMQKDAEYYATTWGQKQKELDNNHQFLVRAALSRSETKEMKLNAREERLSRDEAYQRDVI